ncbi:MAG TPA: DUF4097 family beta strand repeat-containing protein [Thermoanaerobaculia bacterium]|nr:DUF4097 family beta strand repeat-containing protein [Thermoanaerobaculia bacterium]
MRRLFTLAFLFLFSSGAFAAEDTIRRGFRVGDGGTLKLDARIGSVTIVTGGTGVAVEVVRRATGMMADEALRDHEIAFEQRGDDVIITSKHDHGLRQWFSSYRVKWNIRVPARYNVDVRTSGGGIDLAGIGGTVDARTSGGSIRTGRLGGPATLRTSGGSITVAGASAGLQARTSGGSIEIGDTTGTVEARTSGGSIRLARVGGEVAAHTSGGGIRIEDALGRVDATTSGGSIHARLSRQPSGDSRLSTSGGGITLSVARDVKLDLDARASGGGVRSDVPVTITVHGSVDRHSLRGQINGGGPKLVLRTSGGGIRLSQM